MNIQFGRFAEVEIRDYNSKTKTIISNEFEIEFDYFKTVDQTKEDDSGVIRIFGLTPERIKTMQSEGGEVVFRCGYEKSKISTLFTASIVRLYFQTTDNTTVTTIECSANLMNFYHSGGITPSGGSKDTIVEMAVRLGKIIGAKTTEFNITEALVGKESLTPLVSDFLINFEPNVTIFSDVNKLVEEFCRIFQLEYFKKNIPSGGFIAIFKLTPEGVTNIVKQAGNGYKKRVGANTTISDKATVFYSSLQDDPKNNKAIVLDSQTGLVESKTEFKITKAYADEALSGNEFETDDSKEKRSNREAKFWEKEAKKEAVAKKKGKSYKRKKFFEDEYIQISRKYLRVKALLNPEVKPQSTLIVAVKSEVGSGEKPNIGDFEYVSESTVCRVRNVKYAGNNKRGDWIMDLYCEDTDSTMVSQKDVNTALANSSPEDFEVVNAESESSSEF